MGRQGLHCASHRGASREPEPWSMSQSLCCAHDNLVLACKFLPQLGPPQCENTLCTGPNHTGGTPFVFFVRVCHPVSKGQHSYFPWPFTSRMLGRTTHLLLSFLAFPAFIPPSLPKGDSLVPAKYWQPVPHIPGAGMTQTHKLRVGMSEFGCLLKRENTCRLYVLLGALLSLLLCQAEWRPARAGGVEETPLQSSNLLQ